MQKFGVIVLKYNIFLFGTLRERVVKSLIGYFRKQCRTDNGFTIIEVLIAMLILAVGILGLAKMQITGIKGNASARILTNRVVQTTNQIERLLLLPYEHSDLDAGTHPGGTQDGYTLSWEVTVDDPVAGNKTIAVTVTKPGINPFTIEQIKSEIN